MASVALMVFVGVGLVSGLLFGIYLIDLKNTSQLAHVDGPSLSLVTEKSDFKKGEPIMVRLVNSGTVPLSFEDSSYGLRVTGLSGVLMYSWMGQDGPDVTLLPDHEVGFVWDQVKYDGFAAHEGLYKISATGFHVGGMVERSVTITIWK